jgi:chromosome segregation ATPase
MTPTTNREKMLILVLPAAVILIMYSFKLSDLNTRHTSAQTSLAAAEQTKPTAEQFQVEHKQIADLNREMAEIENQNRDWQARWQKLQDDRSTDSTIRIEAIEDLTALLNRNHLDLIDEEPAEGNDGGKLPMALERVATLLKDKKPEVKSQLWRVRFDGRYEDVMRALEELNDTEPLAIPVHLQMGEAKISTATRRWTLYLWI